MSRAAWLGSICKNLSTVAVISKTKMLKSKTQSNNFKARPMPKASVSMTPAAMKARRIEEEKGRQLFRTKCEQFYQSKPELQSKWEKARDVLFVKYGTGTKYKQFEKKLVEKYGKEFQLFEPLNENIADISNNISDGRVACSKCLRKFAPSRVFEHEEMCRGANKRDRHVVEDTGESEEEEEEAVLIARTAASFDEKLSTMTEMEKLQYQIAQMKKLQTLKKAIAEQ